MTHNPSIVALTLQRGGISQPWGFRLSGGSDTDHPLIITKVFLGSPSDGVLKARDLIKKISTYDARDLNHRDAIHLFRNAGSNIDVVIQRNNMVERHEIQNKNVLSFISQPPVAGGVATPFTVAGCGAETIGIGHEDNIKDEQSYRTNLLVLQGPKRTTDSTATRSYLRHHPNPIMTRERPAEYEWMPVDIAKKQVITRQLNSPIDLYSDQHTANATVQSHVRKMTLMKKIVDYDPFKSETYKMLQEIESGNHEPYEVCCALTSRVFSPVKTPAIRSSMQFHSFTAHPKTDYGIASKIHQSDSFKQLIMNKRL